MSENKKTLAERAASAPTDLHRNFAQWLEIETGVKVDLKTVQLACSMRMDFQRSEDNQTDLAKRKAAAVTKRKAEAAAKKARLEAQLAKLQAELAKGDESAEGGPTVATKQAVKKTVAKAATPKPAEPAKASESPAQRKAPARRTRRTAAPKATAPQTV